MFSSRRNIQYIGSTDSVTDRWVNTKSECKSILRDNNVKPVTGLDKPINIGCSQYEPDMNPVQIGLLENFITSEEKHKTARNGGRAGPAQQGANEANAQT